MADPTGSASGTGSSKKEESSKSRSSSLDDLFKRMIQFQLDSAKLYNDQHQAAAVRLDRMENLFLVKAEQDAAQAPAPTTTLEPSRINLQKTSTSDAPRFQGPPQEIEPFVRWIHGMRVWFSTKAVTHADDKIRLIGRVIDDTNLLSVYANEADSFIGKPWKDFQDRLFEVALP